MRRLLNNTKIIYLILLANGFIWVKSSFSKLSGGIFVDTLGKTLTSFASKNPYSWYKNFLQNVAIPNSKTFGELTMWGELLVALVTVLALVYLLFGGKLNSFIRLALGLGLLGGVFLNGVFWLASAWTSASTDSLNLLMFLVQLIGLIFLVGSKAAKD